MEYLFNGFALSAAFTLLCSLGLPLAFRVDSRTGWVLSPIIGLSILTVVSTLLYRSDLSISSIGICVLLAIPVMVYFDRSTYSKAIRSFHNVRVIFLSFLICIFIMLAPMWLGGAQFSVFQGNQWDHFNYIASSVVYGRNAYSAVVSAGTGEFLDNPLMIIAHNYIHARPSINFLFALFMKIAGPELYITTYSFLVLLLALSMFPIYSILERFRNASNKITAKAIAIASICFPIGFWGQYIFDINAWSQIGAIAPLVAVIALNGELLWKKANNDSPSVFHYAALAVCWAGSAYLYPENSLYHLAATSGALLIVKIFARLEWGYVARLLVANLVGLTICFFNIDATFTFLFGQTRFGVSSNVDWWTYFQNFLFGHDNLLTYIIDTINKTNPAETALAKKALAIQFTKDHLFSFDVLTRVLSIPATLLIGLTGFYFAMPSWSMPTIHRLVLNYFILSIVLLVWKKTWVSIRENRHRVPGQVFCFYTGFVGIFILGILILLARFQFWVAGKAVSFLSPYTVIITLIPFLVLSARRDNPGIPSKMSISKPIFTIIMLPVIINLYSGIIRPIKATAHTGIHYPIPYPSIQMPELKNKFRWDIDYKKMTKCNSFHIDVNNSFAQTYWMAVLYSNNKRYHHDYLVNTYYGDGVDIGYMKSTEDPDCEIRCDPSIDNVNNIVIISKVKFAPADPTSLDEPSTKFPPAISQSNISRDIQ